MARSDRNGNGTAIEPTLLKSQLRAGFEGLRHRVTQARSRFQTPTPPTPLLLSHTDQRDSETFVSGAYRRAGSSAYVCGTVRRQVDGSGDLRSRAVTETFVCGSPRP